MNRKAKNPGTASIVACMLLATPLSLAGELVIEIEPSKLVLGGTNQAVVRVWAKGIPEARLDKLKVRLHTNAGSLSPVEPAGPGEWTANYQPPKEFFPQVAIVAAVARNEEHLLRGWATLPLWGVGEAEVRARPRAKVNVRIGEATFGPARTNRFGKASIPIVVPPGVNTGQSAGEDIDLGLPPFNRLAVMADRQTVIADPKRPVPIRIYVVTPEGKPAEKVPFALEANRGSVSDPEFVAAGVYQALYSPPAKVGDGKAAVKVRIEGDEVSEDIAGFGIVAGPPARVTLGVEPGTFRAGSRQKIACRAEVFDANQNPSPVTPVFQSDLGRFDPVQSTGPGSFQANLILPDRFEGNNRTNVQVAVPAGENKEVTATAPLALEPGPPASIRFREETGEIPADGKTAVEIGLEMFDAHGNPVTGESLEALATPGVAGNVRGDREGYRLRYTPTLLRNPGRAVIEAWRGEVHAETERSLKQTDYWFSLSARVGYQNNLGNVSSPWFSGEAEFRLDPVIEGLTVALESGYSFSDSGEEGSGIESKLSMVPLAGTVGYRFRVHPRISLSFDIGCGAYFLSHRLSVDGQPDTESSATVFGLHASFGAGFHLGPGQIILGVRYLYAEADPVEGLSGNVGGLIVMGGYRFGIL